MKSFKTWLAEGAMKDVLMASIYYKIAHSKTNNADTQHNEKMGRSIASNHGYNFDQLESEVREKWKPGGCPVCKGVGYKVDFSNCLDCVGTGLVGMNPVQTKWWLTKKKEVEELINSYDLLAKRRKEFPSAFETKLGKDIITAAKRAGVPNVDRQLSLEDDPEQYTAEWYDGHYQDFYRDVLNGFLNGIAQVTAKKAGYINSSWRK